MVLDCLFHKLSTIPVSKSRDESNKACALQELGLVAKTEDGRNESLVVMEVHKVQMDTEEEDNN